MANIKLNNKTYPIPDSKLATATGSFIAHLGTIAGNGLKVVIGGVEYGVDAAKVAGAVGELEGTLGGLRVKSPAGLYQTGAIALYEEQGGDAIKDMQIKSWEDLLAEGTIHMDNGIVYTNADTDEWTNTSSDALAGDLIIPDDGSITALGDFSNSAWEGRPAFMLCTKLTGIKIPNSITNISDYAIDECEGLAHITIPDSVTSIGEWAFSGCNIMTSIIIPGNVASIGDSAFQSCDKLISVVIDDGVVDIGDKAFSRCYNLSSVVIGNSVTSIGYNAFEKCYSLVEVINKSSLDLTVGSTNNGGVACYAKKVHSGESEVINQDGYLFYPYNNTTYIIGYIGNAAEFELPANYNGESYEINDYAFYDQEDLGSAMIIPDGVTSIGKYAFQYCYNLTSVVIPNSVTTIGDEAFASCKFTSLTIPGGAINQKAFYLCSNLTSVTFGNSLTSIGDSAFRQCGKLTDITFEGTVEQWNAVSKTWGWNRSVPATYVQCSDGTVALQKI